MKELLGYTRSKGDKWIDGVLGAVVRDDARFGLGNLTGYDVAAAIRGWLKESGSEQLSVCEAILLRGEMGGLRKYVGRAGIFWSHVQQEPFLGDVLSVPSGGRAQLKPDVVASTAGLMREVFHHDGATRHFRTADEIAECEGGGWERTRKKR